MCLGPEIALVASIIGGVSAAVGTGVSIIQGQKAAAASERAEALRKRQFDLEAMQKRREAIRRYQLQRATSVSNISGQTGTLQSSAAGGALSAASASIGSSLGELSQAQDIGNQMFQANADYSQASANQQIGQGVANFGKDLFASSQSIGRVGSTLFNGSGGWTTTTENS